MAENSFTQAQFDSWRPMVQFYKDAKAAFGEHVQTTIMDGLCAGLLIARAAHYYDGTASQDGTRIDHGFGRYLMPGFWEMVRDSQPLYSLALWTTGNVKQEVVQREAGSRHAYNVTFQLFGIRLEPKGVAEMLGVTTNVAAVVTIGKMGGVSVEGDTVAPAPAPIPTPAAPVAAPPQPLTVKHAGGAPRKEFWDDLWLAMFERLWLTDWKPGNQAEVEKAMLDWAAQHDHDLGPTSVKTPAKKLFLLSKK